MLVTASCTHCGRSFTFDPAGVPAQTVSREKRCRGPVVSFYPDCPDCGRRVEVTNPALPDVPADDLPRGRPGPRNTGGLSPTPETLGGRTATAARRRAAANGPRPAGPGGSPTVLVVEDDAELSEGLRELLRRHGYRVILAGDGVQGRDAICRDRPDLVVLDMMMPRLGGFPVLEHFRGKPDAPPFVMITGNGGGRHMAYAEMLGVVGYLRKPFAPEALVAAVARGLPARGRSTGGPPAPGRHGRSR